ncbi:MAG TPA: YihY/virulence factor BrkB family protein [Actinomycetota bacterium]|nr:YihY/virulence factor BrkB family protein [Actinomycetota bacterium]
MSSRARQGRERTWLHRLDHYQQRSWLGFPIAVGIQYGRDRCGAFAAMIAFYGYLSILPLFLVAMSLAKIVLGGTDAEQRVLDAIVDAFGVVGEQLVQNIQPTTGDVVAITVGLLVALWGGLGVMQSVQLAFNDIWNVNLDRRPDFLRSRLRSLITIVLLGVIVLIAAIVPALMTVLGFSDLSRFVGFVISYVIAILMLLVTYRALASRELSWGNVAAGAAVAGAVWVLLQVVGSLLLGRWIREASQLYGLFGVSFGLLVWISLAAQIVLAGAEINVVRVRRLWPRSILGRHHPPAQSGD